MPVVEGLGKSHTLFLSLFFFFFFFFNYFTIKLDGNCLTIIYLKKQAFVQLDFCK